MPAPKNDPLIVAALCAGAYTVDPSGVIWIEKPRGGPRRPARLRRNPQGYLRMWMRIGRFRSEVCAHRVVAIAFLGEPPGDAVEVNHKNGDKSDNRLENLEWTTPLQNTRHAHALGLCEAGRRRGELNGRAKLTAEAVSAIRARRGGGEPLATIAKEYGVSSVMISRICRGLART